MHEIKRVADELTSGRGRSPARASRLCQGNFRNLRITGLQGYFIEYLRHSFGFESFLCPGSVPTGPISLVKRNGHGFERLAMVPLHNDEGKFERFLSYRNN